ncbi:hypothetical protein [Leptospira interrogans]|nr:hypothetical protein [Leptospira interrogans]KAK2617144.1 hypothetical protein CFV95_020715 [Leptospira interrogans]
MHDLARTVAMKSIVSMRFLNSIQHSIEDVIGALKANQILTAKHQAKNVIIGCAALRSIKSGGEIFEPEEFEHLFFNPFIGLSQFEKEEVMRFINKIMSSKDNTWIDSLIKFVKQTEDTLGFSDGLPDLRSPIGFQAIIRIVKDWERIGKELGLPSLLPRAWSEKY